MKKLLFLIILLSTIAYGQKYDPMHPLFADLQGNLRDVSGLWFNTLDNKALFVLGGKFTLSQTGLAV